MATVIASGVAGGSEFGVTGPTIDTTGADVILVAGMWYDEENPAFADSFSNTYSVVETVVDGTRHHRLWICTSPIVGAGHIFGCAGAFGALAVLALHFGSPVTLSAPTSATDTNTTLAPGAILPAGDNAVWLTSFGGQNTIVSVSSPFTAATLNSGAMGDHYAIGIAWDLQTTATSRNPTWTAGDFQSMLTIGVAIVPDGGGGGISSPWHHYRQLMG